MKKLIWVLGLTAGCALGEEWVGAISESGCGLKHAAGGGEKCVTACVKKGAAPVFVTDGKVIRIANADTVMDYLGKKVKVTGKIEGDTVTVDRIEVAK